MISFIKQLFSKPKTLPTLDNSIGQVEYISPPQSLIGRKVKLSREYIRNWVFSHANWEGYKRPGGVNQEFSDAEYDQEILLAMFTLMGEPVYGEIKGFGIDSSTVLCLFYHDGCSIWAYIDLENVVLLD